MASKASLIVILALVQKTKWPPYHMFKVRHLFAKTLISRAFIYKDIFTKFARDVYSYENLSLQNFSLILKNKMAAIANCLKIIKVL